MRNLIIAKILKDLKHQPYANLNFKFFAQNTIEDCEPTIIEFDDIQIEDHTYWQN